MPRGSRGHSTARARSFRLAGAPALSEFRRERLLARLEALGIGIVGVGASYRYYVDAEANALDAGARERLHALLDAVPTEKRSVRGTSPPGDARGDGSTAAELFVVPRPGTRSPWSSKATDILHVCGLAAVRRVERGVRYRLEGLSPERLEAALADGALARALHDRMTEAVLVEEAEAARLFETEPPRPLESDAGGTDRAQAARRDRLGTAPATRLRHRH